LIWILFLAAAGGVIAYFISSYRKKVAEREAASKERFKEMFLAQPKPAPDRPPEPVPSAGALPVTKTPPVGVTSPVVVAAPPARERFLDQRETLLYRLLKVGIPDHEIFANVSLASVAGGRNEQEMRRLAQYQVNFVVCDKNMRVVAAVEFEQAGGGQALGDLHFKTECLKSAGINLVRVNPAALPRRDDIRGLVCGQSKPAS